MSARARNRETKTDRIGRESLLDRLRTAARELGSLPSLTINLRYAETQRNEEFFRRYTMDFYRETQRRHRKLPLVKAMTYGVALKVMEDDFDAYFMSLDGSARRNYKKARRNGFEFGKLDYNEKLDEIREILASAEVRQGKMPEHLLKGETVAPVRNPVSKTDIHDYPFYGVTREGKVRAYAGCFVCGDLCMIESIYGHAEYQSFGVVPLLIISIAREILEEYPGVRYYGYGTMYGASREMQRFKRKFRFEPAKVKWVLG